MIEWGLSWHMADIMQPKTVCMIWHDKWLEILNTCSDLGQQRFLQSVCPACVSLHQPSWRKTTQREIQSLYSEDSNRSTAYGVFGLNKITRCIRIKRFLTSVDLREIKYACLTYGRIMCVRDQVLCGIVPPLSVGNEELAPVVLRRKMSAFHVINGFYHSNQ